MFNNKLLTLGLVFCFILYQNNIYNETEATNNKNNNAAATHTKINPNDRPEEKKLDIVQGQSSDISNPNLISKAEKLVSDIKKEIEHIESIYPNNNHKYTNESSYVLKSLLEGLNSLSKQNNILEELTTHINSLPHTQEESDDVKKFKSLKDDLTKLFEDLNSKRHKLEKKMTDISVMKFMRTIDSALENNNKPTGLPDTPSSSKPKNYSVSHVVVDKSKDNLKESKADTKSGISSPGLKTEVNTDYVNFKENISDDQQTSLFDNRNVIYTSIAAASVLILGLIALVFWKKKRPNRRRRRHSL